MAQSDTDAVARAGLPRGLSMRSFVNARLSRETALAQARTTEGAAALQGRLFEQTEGELQVPQAIGDLIDALTRLNGDALLPRLLDAIAESSDLAAVAPLFIHWVLTTEMQTAPADFEGLNAVRAAAILATERRLSALRDRMSPAQADALHPLLTGMGERTSLFPHAIDAHQAHWRQRAKSLAAAQSYVPARRIAQACGAAFCEAPGVIALLVAGWFGGDSPRGINERLRDKTLALLAAAPVTTEQCLR